MEHIDVNNQQLLLQALEGSVSADDNHRKKCEEYLINFSLNEGAIPALMRVISNFQADDSVRLAASIRLKNHVLSHWVPDAADGANAGAAGRPVIGNADRAFLLDNLYLCLVSAGPARKAIRNQCFEALRHIMFHVEIKDVQTLLAAVSADLAQRNDSDRILCALACLRKVMTKYEYHGSSQAPEVNEVLTAYFGPLLAVAQDASKIGLANDEAATLIHMVLKIYFSAALLTSPTISILKDSMAHWMALVNYVLTEFTNWQMTWPGRRELEVGAAQTQASPFSELSNELEEQLSQLEQFKSAKWALRILNRLMSRQNSFADDPNKNQFFTMFISNNHINDSITLVLKMLKAEADRSLALNNMLHHLMWTHLRHCLSAESHFQFLIKGKLAEIVGGYCLNTFKYTHEDVAHYEEDPETFIQSLCDVSFQFSSNRGSCSDFLKELVKKYPAEALVEIKQVLNAGFETTESTTLYAVLSVVGYVADRLVRKNKRHSGGEGQTLNSIVNKPKNKHKEANFEHLQVDGEELLELKVVGLLAADDVWIRMRAAWLCGCVLKRLHNFRKFDTLRGVYVRLLEMLGDPELLVAVFAADALIEVFNVENDALQDVIVTSISVLLERLFLLMGRIELESVTSVLGQIVEYYPDEVVPFAKEIVANVTTAISRGLVSQGAAGAKGRRRTRSDDDDDKMLVRWSMLQTLNTVVRLLAPDANAEHAEPKDKPREPSETKLALALDSYAFIVNAIVALLKLLFDSRDENCTDYIDEAALLLANLVKMLDVAAIKQMVAASGQGLTTFWQLFGELLELVKSQNFEVVSDFSVVREPLVALARRDPQGFASVLENFYRICLEASSNGFVEEVDEVLADCLEVCINTAAMNKVFEPLLADTATRASAVLGSAKRTSPTELAADNSQLMRLANLLVLYYYQNFAANPAALSGAALSQLAVATTFILKFAVHSDLPSIRRYCILTFCALVKNNVTRVDDVSVLSLLVTLVQNAKNEKSEDEDEYEYSSESDDYEDLTDDDDDSDWEEYEFEDSPFRGVCELKLAKEVLMAVNEPLELHQVNRRDLMALLNSIS